MQTWETSVLQIPRLKAVSPSVSRRPVRYYYRGRFFPVTAFAMHDFLRRASTCAYEFNVGGRGRAVE